MKAKACQRLFNVVLLVFLSHEHFQALGEKAVLLHKDRSSFYSWQWLTRFEFGAWSGWSQDGNSGSYTVCDLSETATNHTNSWLVSEYVDLQGANEVQIGLTFIVRQCPAGLKYCKQSFSIYALQTDGQVASGISKQDIESGNFTLVETVNATYLWTPPGNSPKVNQPNLTFAVSSKGIYLAFRDTGSCLAVTSVTLSYKYCPTVVNHGVVFKKIAAPSSSQQNTTISGNCSDKASPYPSNSTLSLTCLSSGQWVMDNKVTCLCTTGYELVGDKCTGCQAGYYKESIGNGQCIPCPSNSAPDPSHSSCVCQSGFYRAPEDATSGSCTAPPSEPRDISITIISDGVVVVAWFRPANDGGRNDVKYDVRCNACSNMGSCSSNCSDARFWPSTVDLTTPQVMITDFGSAAYFNITVISKNGVSGQAGASSLKYLYKTFSFTKNNAQSTTATLTATAPTTTEATLSRENNATTMKTVTTGTALEVPVQGTASSKVSAAIGISVTVTFIACFLIALVVIIFLMKKWKRKYFDQQSLQSSSTQLTDISRSGTSLKRMRSTAATTELTENGSIPNLHFEHERTSPTPPVPAINVEDAKSITRPNSTGSNHSRISPIPQRIHKIVPALNRTPPRSITPMLLPRKRDSLATDFIDSPRKPPEGSELARVERSMSINSWFPVEEVQYNV